MKYIAKFNRSLSAGSGLPSPYPIATTIFLISSFCDIKESKSKEVLALIFLHLLRGLKISNDKQFDSTNFLRLKCDDTIIENALRITKTKGVSWPEYSIAINESAKPEQSHSLIWVPIPSQLKDIFLEVIRATNIGQRVFNKNDFHIAKKAIRNVPKQAKVNNTHHYSTRIQLFNYVPSCVTNDTQITPLTKLAWFGNKGLGREHVAFYISFSSDQLRAEIFWAQEKYINRILDLIINNQTHPTLANYSSYVALLCKAPIFPPYIRADKTQLPEVRRDNRQGDTTVKNYRKVPFLLGCKHIPTELEIESTLITLSNIKDSLKLRSKTSKSLKANLNVLSAILAIKLILFTGCRPTHHIGPSLEYIDSHGFTIYDKGAWRNIPLTETFYDEITSYINYRTKLLESLNIETQPSALLLVSDPHTENLSAISVSRLKSFLKGNGIEIFPYQFRRYFAQSLSNNGCPSHFISQLMGHYNYGEQAGMSNVYDTPNAQLLSWLEQHESNLRKLYE